MTKTFRNTMQGVRSFMFVVDGAGKILDACDGVAALEYNRQYVIGKSLFDVLPLAYDAPRQKIKPGEIYQIKNNTLFLRDRKISLESHIISINSGSGQLYRVFNIINNS